MTGPVTGFLLEWEGHRSALYISGDTVPFAGTEEIARRVGPVGVAILHVGWVELPGVDNMTFSMSAEEAADYAAKLDARAVVPVHYDGWKHFSETRTAAENSFAHSAIGDRVHWLEPGHAQRFALSSS